ncbi:MAG: hypothetical protein WD749_10925 [Phycisphaerales bacterium]
MFRTVAALLAASAALSAGGCQNKHGTTPIHDDRGAYNIWTIETVNDGSVRNAVIAQHTLYPYHFVDFSDQLNELGRRDVQVLAAHYRRYPGPVNIRRGSEPEDLYRARVAAVAEALASGGVDREKIRIADGMPGGPGNPADRVITIQDAERSRLQGGGSPTPTGTPARPTPASATGSTSTQGGSR